MTKKYVCAVCAEDGEPCVLTVNTDLPPIDCPFESHGYAPSVHPDWVEVKQ